MTTDVPIPQPAANTRSPNRKPRNRRVTQLWAAVRAKSMFLVSYRVTGGDIDRAVAVIGRDRDVISLWCRKDLAFAAEYESAKKQVSDGLSDEMPGLATAAVVAIREAVTDKSPVRRDLKLRAAIRILEGVGVLANKSALELSGKDGGPVVIKIVRDGNG